MAAAADFRVHGGIIEAAEAPIQRDVAAPAAPWWRAEDATRPISATRAPSCFYPQHPSSRIWILVQRSAALEVHLANESRA